MGFFDLFKTKEVRASPEELPAAAGGIMSEDLLAAIFNDSDLTREIAMQIPAVKGCLEKLSGSVRRLPICLYRRRGAITEQVTDDYRLFLLNNEPENAMNADEFWQAMITDYYMGVGGFALLQYRGAGLHQLNYIENGYLSFHVSPDRVAKDYDILVNGKSFAPFRFLKIRHDTQNGAYGVPLWKKSPLVFSVAYHMLILERMMAANGGVPKGYLASEKNLTQEALDKLKAAWQAIYKPHVYKAPVLNNGVKFENLGSSAAEMQLSENKAANTADICRLFGFSASVLTGNTTAEDRKEYISAVMVLINVIEAALDRDLLTEEEKQNGYYFAFDTRELTRGDLKERYAAYEIAARNSFLQLNEIRAMEDLPPMDFNFIRLGLQDCLLDPQTGQLYTPNMNAYANLKGGEIDNENGNQSG